MRGGEGFVEGARGVEGGAGREGEGRHGEVGVHVVEACAAQAVAQASCWL